MGSKDYRDGKCLRGKVNLIHRGRNKIVVIYFNHWFSSIYNVIQDIKREYPEATIIASSKNKDAMYKGLADLFLVEPSDKEMGTDGVKWFYDVCKEYNVDIFFCKRCMTLISLCKEKFLSIGTRVIADDFKALSKITSKISVYQFLRDMYHENYIPDYRVVYSVNGLERALYTMLSIHPKVVVKLSADEGGNSVRIVSNTKANNTFIDGAPFREITIEQLLNSYHRLIERKANTEMIVMPYMNSEEISIDCYSSKNGFVAIPRIKGNTRAQEIKSIPELEKLALDIRNKFDLHHPFNVQFRRFNWVGEQEIVGPELSSGYKLLDLNPRMSGGIYMSSVTGINIPLLCIKDILGDTNYDIAELKPIKVGHVEYPVILENLEDE